MLEIIIRIQDRDESSVEISTDLQGDIDDASEMEQNIGEEILDYIDDMITIINDENAKETTKDICSKIGKS